MVRHQNKQQQQQTHSRSPLGFSNAQLITSFTGNSSSDTRSDEWQKNDSLGQTNSNFKHNTVLFQCNPFTNLLFNVPRMSVKCLTFHGGSAAQIVWTLPCPCRGKGAMPTNSVLNLGLIISPIIIIRNVFDSILFRSLLVRKLNVSSFSVASH